MRLSAVLLPLTICVTSPALGADGQLVVPTLSTSGVDGNVAPVVTELVLEALLSRHQLSALGPSDLKDLLNAEQQRQLLGCDESACLAELAGALGSARLVSGLVGRLGDLFVVTLKLVDLSNAQVIARASTRFQKLEQAPEAIGPLVDELLGAKAKPRAAMAPVATVAERKKAEEKQRALSPADFCQSALDQYASQLLEGQARRTPLPQRGAILRDLLLTPFSNELDRKLACIEDRHPKLSEQLTDRRLAADTPESAERARIAELEWAAARTEVKLVVEAYQTGLEKEKLGTGARPIALPFAMSNVVVPALPKRPDVDGYVESFRAGAAVLGEALAAVASSKKAAFVTLFGGGKEARARDPRDVYVDVLRFGEKAALSACPVFVLDPGDVLREAKAFRERGRLVAFVRKVETKTGHVTLDPVELTREGATWRITRWPAR